jgi:hypothetical protein
MVSSGRTRIGEKSGKSLLGKILSDLLRWCVLIRRSCAIRGEPLLREMSELIGAVDEFIQLADGQKKSLEGILRGCIGCHIHRYGSKFDPYELERLMDCNPST